MKRQVVFLFMAVAVAFSINSCSSGKSSKGSGFCKDLNEIISIAEKQGTQALQATDDPKSESLGKSWDSKKSVYGMKGTIYENMINEGAHYASYRIVDKVSEEKADQVFNQYREMLVECLGNDYYENESDDDMGQVRWYYVNGEDILNTTHAYISLSESKWGDNDNEVYLYIYDPAK